MKKILVVFVPALLLILSVTVSLPSEVSAEPDLPVYNIDTGMNYATIQEAIDAPETQNWHTIKVDAGTYYEHVVVNKTVNLVGEDPEITVIDGNGTLTILNIVTYNVNVTGFGIQNGDLGVYLPIGADACVVRDCRIIGNIFGVYVESDYTVLTKNIIANNSEAGIKIFASCGCSPVHGNIVTENKLLNNNYGISLTNSVEGVVYHNDLVNNMHQVSSVGSFSNWGVHTYIHPYAYAYLHPYSYGGNYWSDYTDVDLYSGPNQDEIGCDGIWDHPYVIDGDNRDNYPLTRPYVSPEEMQVLYNDLLVENESLNSTYRELLNSYGNVQASYDQLSSSYNTLQSELNDIRNLLYGLTATAVGFMIATVYLAIRTGVFRVKT